MADGYARGQRTRRRLQRAPGTGPDQHDDRADRGGQEPHAAAGAGRRDAGRRADLQFPDRPARAGRVGGGDRRACAWRRQTPPTTRCAPITARRIERRPVVLMLPIDIQAQPAAGRARSARARRPAAAPAAVRREQRSRRSRTLIDAPGARRSSPAAARCWPTPAPSSSGSAAAIGAAARHLRPRQRPVRRPARTPLGISGGFASPVAAELIGAGRPDPRLRRIAQPLDDPARRADRPARPRSSRSTSSRARSRATGRPTSRLVGDAKAAAAELIEELDRREPRPTPACARAEMAEQIASRGAGATSPTRTPRTDEYIDPRTLSIALDDGCRPTGRWPSTPATSSATRRCTSTVPDARALGVRQRLSGGRARAGQRDRRGDRPTRSAHRRRDRRRRRVHGPGRARDRRAAEARQPAGR